MNELTDKLQEVERNLEKECASSKRAFAIVSVAYGVLFLFVLAYTTFVFNAIRDLATPDALMANATEYAQRMIPQVKESIAKEVKGGAPKIADHLMLGAHAMIPKAKDFVKLQIDAFVDAQLKKAQDSLIPSLKDEFEKAFAEAEASSEQLREKDLAKVFAIAFSSALADEFDKMCGDQMKSQMAWLRDEINMLAVKPEARLNAREKAEKTLLTNWLYLVNNAKVGERPFATTIRLFTDVLKHVDGFFIDE